MLPRMPESSSDKPAFGERSGLPGSFLFLDESGDLGLAAGSTPFFAVGVLHLKSRSALKRVIKRARRKSLGHRAHLNELKWSQSSERVRAVVMEQIAREAPQIAGISACVIDKRWINTTLARRREVVRYNYAVRLAFEKGGLFSASTRGRRIHLTIDARNRRATETLSEYVQLLEASGDLACTIEVSSDDSARCPQLQAADFVIGAIYAAYAHEEWKYFDLLRNAGIAVKLRALKRKLPAP
jgi:Protein of unknown function (DUF3800)